MESSRGNWFGGRGPSSRPGNNTPASPGQLGDDVPYESEKGKAALSQANNIGEGEGVDHTQVAPAPLIARLSHDLARQRPSVTRLLGPQLSPIAKEEENSPLTCFGCKGLFSPNIEEGHPGVRTAFSVHSCCQQRETLLMGLGLLPPPPQSPSLLLKRHLSLPQSL